MHIDCVQINVDVVFLEVWNVQSSLFVSRNDVMFICMRLVISSFIVLLPVALFFSYAYFVCSTCLLFHQYIIIYF
jgi:hypothetical protein